MGTDSMATSIEKLTREITALRVEVRRIKNLPFAVVSRRLLPLCEWNLIN